MSSVPNPTTALYEALKPLLPGLPKNVSRLSLTLEHGKPPVVECSYMPDVDGEAVVPVEPVTGKYALVAIGGMLTGEHGVELTRSAADTLKKYGAGAKNTQTMTIKVDTSGLDDLVERMERYAQMHYGCAAAALKPVEMIQGKALALEPDPRLDEIVSLLKRIDAHLSAPIETVAFVPGR